MALFQDVTISGEAEGLVELRRRLGSTNAGGWRRDHEAEARFRSMGAHTESTLCLVRDADAELPAAALWFVPHGPGKLRLANMIPLGRGSTIEEADFVRILVDFRHRVFNAANEGLAMKWEVGFHPDPEMVLSDAALRKFRSFARSSDRRALHPADVVRWNEFLVQIHRDGSPVEPEMLPKWLRSEGWPDEVGKDLAREFQSALDLLAAYDEGLAAR